MKPKWWDEKMTLFTTYGEAVVCGVIGIILAIVILNHA
jgi:hypothetical protein